MGVRCGICVCGVCGSVCVCVGKDSHNHST